MYKIDHSLSSEVRVHGMFKQWKRLLLCTSDKWFIVRVYCTYCSNRMIWSKKQSVCVTWRVIGCKYVEIKNIGVWSSFKLGVSCLPREMGGGGRTRSNSRWVNVISQPRLLCSKFLTNSLKNNFKNFSRYFGLICVGNQNS